MDRRKINCTFTTEMKYCSQNSNNYSGETESVNDDEYLTYHIILYIYIIRMKIWKF